MSNDKGDEMSETVEAEIVEDEFLAPVLKNAKELTTLVNTDELIKEYSELASIDISTPVEEISLKFIEIEKGFKAFRKARTSIERTRKEIGEPAFQFHKKVIEIAKEIQKTINPYEERLKALVSKVENEEKRKQIEIEEAEEQRVTNIKRIINQLKDNPTQCIGKTSKVITEALELLECPSREILEEFFDEAFMAYTQSQTQMLQMLENQNLVENAQKIQEEAKQKADAEEVERQALRDAEQKKLDEEKAEFRKQKDDFEAQQKAIQEEADRMQAAKEADELMAKQKAEKKQKDLENKEAYDELYNEAWDDLQEAFENKREALLDLIIEGKIRNVKWSPNGN